MELSTSKSDVNLIGTIWVFKIKRKANDTIKRYKSRLVAQGFKQHKDIDYGLIYSPVVKYITPLHG